MTQAPATTVATAVRQHGGGRHPLSLPCTAPTGRLQDSRGGVINRRAEGATSSNTLPASCAAAAHPTTGVRRARELSTSLCSQSCQHAQLVEGYTAMLHLNRASELPALIKCLSIEHQRVIQRSLGLFACQTQMFRPSPQGGRAAILMPKYKNQRSHTASRVVNFDLPVVIEVIIKIAVKPFLEGFQKASNPPITFNAYICIREHSAHQEVILSNQRMEPQRHSAALLRPVSNPPLLISRLLSRGNPDCRGYSCHRSNRLHPGCTHFAGIHRQHQEVCRSEDQNHTGHRDQMLPYPLPAALAPHPYYLDTQEHRPSLPAPCHHVQRGTA